MREDDRGAMRQGGQPPQTRFSFFIAAQPVAPDLHEVWLLAVGNRLPLSGRLHIHRHPETVIHHGKARPCTLRKSGTVLQVTMLLSRCTVRVSRPTLCPLAESTMR